MYPLALLLFFVLAVTSVRANSVDFVREVRPLLEKHCFSCHGPEKQKSGYRLDVREIALTGGETHAPNIVPGKPGNSPLLRFVSGEDAEMRMPPKGDLLTVEERRVLEAWLLRVRSGRKAPRSGLPHRRTGGPSNR